MPTGSMEKIIKYVRYLDYLGAVASLLWGIVHLNPIWIGFGVLGLIFAWWSPAKRLNSLAERKLISKRKGVAVTETTSDESTKPPTDTAHQSFRKPDYGYRTDLPYPRGIRVFRFQGRDNYLQYALYIGATFGQKRL